VAMARRVPYFRIEAEGPRRTTPASR